MLNVIYYFFLHFLQYLLDVGDAINKKSLSRRRRHRLRERHHLTRNQRRTRSRSRSWERGQDSESNQDSSSKPVESPTAAPLEEPIAEAPVASPVEEPLSEAPSESPAAAAAPSESPVAAPQSDKDISTWTELLGKTYEEAEEKIKSDRPDVIVYKIIEGSAVTKDYRLDRVRVFVDTKTESIVVEVPRIG